MASDKLLNYALTTKDRIKDRLGVKSDNTGFDVLFTRLCNAVSDYIENACSIRFLETTYTDQVYSVRNGQSFLYLRNFPVSSVSTISYRIGLPGNPTWVSFLDNEYELLEDGRQGMIKFYIYINGINSVKVSYVAGYKIDWANVGDLTKHTLPADLTDLAERLVVRWFKRREHEGKDSESFDRGNTNWSKELTAEDKDTIASFKRMVFV
jgi:hypothetical protein